MNKRVQYLQLAADVSKLSRDASTKIGCVILGEDWEVKTIGYNGLPRKADETKRERHERPEKYFWYEHAERNAIYNAARSGTALNKSTAYITMMPCIDCARALVQSGIKEVVVSNKEFTANPEKWNESIARTLELFKEAGIELIVVEEKLIEWPTHCETIR